jgi:hypothetical protein
VTVFGLDKRKINAAKFQTGTWKEFPDCLNEDGSTPKFRVLPLVAGSSYYNRKAKDYLKSLGKSIDQIDDVTEFNRHLFAKYFVIELVNVAITVDDLLLVEWLDVTQELMTFSMELANYRDEALQADVKN